MKTAYLVTLLCASTVLCYPAKPLNERSTEVAWGAFLLMDASRPQAELGAHRRRITPKSVFITKNFTADVLPPCAEGYRSDTMGVCVRIYKIKEEEHLNFLLGKLTKQFGVDDEEPDQPPTPGPVIFNIPLNGENSDNKYDNDANVAIIVVPTRTTLPNHIDVKRKGTDKFNTENIAAIIGVNPEDIESTTIKELASTQTETTFTAITATESGETTTLETTTSEVSDGSTTTESDSETTTVTGEALFFQWT